MKVFELNPLNPEPELIGQIASFLKKSGVIAYPTDTFYGLGGDGFSPEVHHRIMILKGREGTKPFPYIIDRVDRIKQWRLKLSAVASALAKTFWPGPVSLVMKGPGKLPGHIFDTTETICLRVPGNLIACAIAEALDGLLVSTSANLAGMAPACCARETMGYFRGEIDAVVDGGPSTCRAPSTIVDVTGNDIAIIREGAVAADRIYAVAERAMKKGNG